MIFARVARHPRVVLAEGGGKGVENREARRRR